MDTSQAASTLQLLGAGAFGALIGWQVYFVNRYRTDKIELKDLGALLAILAGSGIIAIFPQRTDLFGAYGIGLFAGFFLYFLMLVAFVAKSENFDWDWFLDGRRKTARTGEIPDWTRKPTTAMEVPEIRATQLSDEERPRLIDDPHRTQEPTITTH